MANLIRLKQIESGSALQTSATVGTDFTGAVYEIIDAAGLISSSIQVDITQTTNFVEFSSSISASVSETNINTTTLSSSVATSFGNVYTQLANITGSLETGLSASVATSFSQSNAVFNIFSASVQSQFSASSAKTIDISASVNSRLTNLESFSSSLDDGFATDAELTVTSSQIIDQGEF